MDDDLSGQRSWLKRILLRLAGESPIENATALERDIQDLEQRGLLGESEGAMIESLLDFGETLAREVMVPRTSVRAVPVDCSVEDILELVRVYGHSRLPVHRDSIDDIIGVLHVKDLLPHWGADKIDLAPLLRQAMFAPETKLINDMLAEMRSRQSHMAIVVDEYGGTAGIVTIEDIIEEIVGEIQDEHDAEEPQLVELDDGAILVDATMDVGELSDVLGVELPKDGYDTIGGFVIAQHGAVPEVGQAVVSGPLTLTVDQADERRVLKIRIDRDRPEPD